MKVFKVTAHEKLLLDTRLLGELLRNEVARGQGLPPGPVERGGAEG